MRTVDASVILMLASAVVVDCEWKFRQMWSQWLLTSLSYPSSILLISLLWVAASENRKYISTDHFVAKVMRSVVSVRFSTISFEPADLELDVRRLYGYHRSSSEIESQGYKSRSSLGFGFRNGKGGASGNAVGLTSILDREQFF